MNLNTTTLQTSISLPTSSVTTFFGQSPNQNPTIQDFSVDSLVNTTYTFTQSDILTNYTDADGNGVNKIQICTVPLIGKLLLNGSVVRSGDELIISNINQLVYIPRANEAGLGYSSFEIKVKDNGLAPNCWSDSATVTINITKPNQEPTVTDKTITINYESSYTFILADLIADYDDVEGDSLGYIEFTSIPPNNFGILTLDNIEVQLNNLPIQLTAADIAQGRLRYIDTGEFEQNKSIGFDYNVFDNV